MVVKIKFGSQGIEKTVIWDKIVDDFPKLIRFDGKKWEWIFFKEIMPSEYELVFSELPTYDPNFYADMPSFEEMFPNGDPKCECGSRFSSFEWDHYRFCKLWRPW